MRTFGRYKDIQARVKATKGYSVETCWIADVKEQSGLNVRRAPNRLDPDHRANPCPADKQEAIIEALRYYGLI